MEVERHRIVMIDGSSEEYGEEDGADGLEACSNQGGDRKVGRGISFSCWWSCSAVTCTVEQYIYIAPDTTVTYQA